MGGFDVYCYLCGVPVYDLREFVEDKQLYCNIPSKLLEELRYGYFKTNNGVKHNVKDFDTGGYFSYVDTNTNTKKDANDLLDRVDDNFDDCLCHRKCSKYLRSIDEYSIKELFHKYIYHHLLYFYLK